MFGHWSRKTSISTLITIELCKKEGSVRKRSRKCDTTSSHEPAPQVAGGPREAWWV